MSTHKKFKKTGQQGVTLLLSILVLAAILSIAFSLATVTFVEIRSSGDLVRTEPTYYAADAISEEALFTVKRNVSDTTYPYDNGIGTVSLTSNTSFISTAIFQATVPKTSYDFISTRSRFPIYDTQCLTPNSANMTNCPTGGSGYGRIKITYLDTGNTDHLKVFLCQFDPSKPINPSGTWPEVYTSTPCSNPYDTSNYYWLTPASGDDLTSGNTNNNVRETGTGSWPSINPNLQQELIFYNSGSTADIHVQIETFDSNGAAKGLPLVGSKAVDITASSQGVVRKIRTTIPLTSFTGSVGAVNVASIDLTGQNNSYAQVSNYSSLNTSTFTLEAWIYPRRLNYPAWQPIVVKENSSGNSRNYGMFITDSTYVVNGGQKLHYSFQAANCATYRSYETSSNLSLNTWNHIAITYDGTSFKAYLNGILDSTQTPPSGICTSSQPIWIGGGQSVFTNNNALIDEVRVWNVARTQAEISAAKNSLLTGSESGLVGYWKFNENSGNSAANSVSGGNPATFGSQAGWSTSVPFP